MRFKPNQEVVCKDGSHWFFVDQFIRTLPFFRKKPKPAPGPKTGDIITVQELTYWPDGMRLSFHEWGTLRYPARCFEPLISDLDLMKALNPEKEKAP